MLLIHSQIENTLYKLHRDILCSDSQVFKNMFASGIPAHSSGEMDGTSDENPIVLQQQCTAEEFNQLLTWFYPSLCVLRSC